MRGDLTLLTSAQQAWLADFESAAIPADPAPWLDRAASSARAAGLAATADYLATCARVLRGEASIEDAERAMRKTLDSSLFVIVRFDGKSISDLVICTCDPQRNRTLAKSLEQFGVHDRSTTRAMTRIANLHFRAGKNANVAPTGTYLPFDRTMTPAIGRTWIVYENVMRANWWGEGIRPVALRLFPRDAQNATAEALISWYGARAPIYDAGPPLTSADKDRLGSSRDPLSIMKGDLLPILLAKSTDAQIATFISVSFHTLNDVASGNAPPPHRTATTSEINWLVERGALKFDEASGTWSIDYAKSRSAIADLATEVMAIERTLDAKRAEAMFAKYAASSAAIDRSVAAVAALPAVKVQPLFVR